ncbi:MAG: DNA (cytosine-5-)-methyltransferase [Xenococcus sp. (in: cyanobacteria)]
MRVLSLFDGISGGQQALKELGIKIESYYASEIDKHAIKITQKNHPNTIQLGDVTKLDPNQLPEIDLLLCGSPCQGFSMAGKKLAFDDPRSKLFFEFIRIKNAIKPKYFLFENVRAKARQLTQMDSYIGVGRVMLNSRDFSAQSRVRCYWSNLEIKKTEESLQTIEDIKDPSDTSSILDDSRYTFYPINARYRSRSLHCLGGILSENETTRDGTLRHITVGNLRANQRVYPSSDKSPTVLASRCLPYFEFPDYTRKPTLLELERLQTFPDNYTEDVGKAARVRTLGNAWNVATIKHILKPLV